MPKLEQLVAAVWDTHVWIWASAGDERAAGMKQFKGSPVISAISVWEVAMLERKGRLSLSPGLEEWIEVNLGPPVILEPLSPAISMVSCQLLDFRGDRPGDRSTAYHRRSGHSSMESSARETEITQPHLRR